MKRLLSALVLLLCVFSVAGFAQEDAAMPFAPEVPKAVGAPHPEGNEFMRINHMNLLLHDRDQTLRLGDRTIDYSLKECVACHAVQGPDSEPVGYESPQYFCRTCHDFAAVKIDCFTCHQSTPDEEILRRLLLERPASMEQDAAALESYLQDEEEDGEDPPQQDDESQEVTQ